MSWLLQLIQTPIVVYTIVLTIAWILIQLASKFGYKEIKVQVNEKFLFIILGSYILLTLITIQMNVEIFPFIQAVMLALIMWTVLSTSLRRSTILLVAILIIALMPVVVMVSTKHPFPLGDDARFIGFAGTIAENGRWIPFKYEENPYYQFFHLIPFIEYILALVPRFGLENIPAYYLLIKLNLYFMYFISIYLIMKKLTYDNLNSLVAILLLSITPPSALSQVVHQNYAVVLFLITAFSILHNFEDKKPISSILVMLPLLIAGVIAHATYTIMLLVFIISIIKLKGKKFKNFISVVCLSALLISLTYWSYIYVLDTLIRPAISAVDRLIELLTGAPYPLFQAAKPWYAETSFFVAWALIPAMAVSFVSPVAFKIILRKDNSLEKYIKIVSIMGVLGLGGTVLNYILRALPTFGGRYFYWLYLLMLPSSAILMTKTSKKIISLMLSIILISVATFYGIQDPTLAANTYGNRIGWADKESWGISYSISVFLDSSLHVRADARLATPLSAIARNSFNSAGFNIKPDVLLIGIDKIGLSQISSESNVAQLMNTNYSNIVFTSSFYRGFWA
jgi:hypothetical protein